MSFTPTSAPPARSSTLLSTPLVSTQWLVESVVAGDLQATLVCALPTKNYSGETGDGARPRKDTP